MTAPERSCWTCRWANGDLCDRPHLSEEMDAAIDDYVVAAGCHKNGGGMPIDRTVACPGHEAVLLMPHEALALVAEVERLRAEADLLRTGLDATRAYADRVEAEVLYLRGERAAVVAWLRADDADEFAASEHADFIESGEHRREEDK